MVQQNRNAKSGADQLLFSYVMRRDFATFEHRKTEPVGGYLYFMDIIFEKMLEFVLLLEILVKM